MGVQVPGGWAVGGGRGMGGIGGWLEGGEYGALRDSRKSWIYFRHR